MNDQQPHDLAGEMKSPAGNRKKKASWFRTILWILSMFLLANIFMGILAYFVLFYHK